MKSMARWCATLGLVSTTVLSSWFGTSNLALALPKDQIIQKLGVVPVFSIADREGNPLLFAVQNNANAAGMRVFINQEDAQKFVEQLKKDNPEVGNNFNNIIVVSLSKIYEINQENENNTNPLIFKFEPRPQEVESALNILRQEDEKVQKFMGVPLFFATVTKDDQEAYLRTEQGVIPLFFDQEPLQRQLEEFKEKQPDLAANIEINVIALEEVIAYFQKEDNESLRKMVLVPSESSLTFIESLQKRSSQPESNTNTNTPAAQP